MILNTKFSLILCVILLSLILVSVFSKEIIYETYNIDRIAPRDINIADIKIKNLLTDINNLDQPTIDGMKCLARYNVLVNNYTKSLNNINKLMKKPNMVNSHFDKDPPIGITKNDLINSQKCKPLYLESDSNFYKNVLYDEHYINWVNINILRHFGNNTGNHICSKFLGVNLQDNESMSIENNISPSLVSLHPIGLYNSNELDLPESDDEYFEVIPITISFKHFYTTLVKKLSAKNTPPAKRYFGIIYKDGNHVAYLAKQIGERGLIKLVQGCALGNKGPDIPVATITHNNNIKNLTVPPNAPDLVQSVDFISSDYFDKITDISRFSIEGAILVYGFFV